MGARYVFFRDSTGRAYRRDDGRHTPTHLLAEMGEASVLQGEQIAWKGWHVEHDALLSSFVVLDNEGAELNHQDANTIVWRALEDVARRSPGKPLNSTEVLKVADARAAEHLRRPFVQYELVTSLSIKTFPAKRIRIRGSVIRPLKKREPRYPLPKVLRSASHRNLFADHFKSTRYQLVRVETKGRTIFEGVGNALNALSLLRAIWSFSATIGRRSIRLGSGKRAPIGVIHTGPLYTLHNRDGSAANDEYYWFDPNYAGDQELFKEDDRWSELEKDRRWAIRRIGNLPYRKELEEVLIRYISALDQPNPNVAFLQLWGTLERITNTVGAQYDETIKRACRVYVRKDRPLMKEALESLRHYRNRYVHSGDTGHETEQIAFRIKSYVDPHLVRLMNNTFKVQSLQEYGDFLAYPTDLKALEQTRSWSSRAIFVASLDDSA
jgi:hypothetical protein